MTQSKAPHITLIRPAKVLSPKTFSSPSVPSIGLAYLAANLAKHGLSFHFIDALGEALEQIEYEETEKWKRFGLSDQEIIQRIPPESPFIGISCMFSTEWPYYQRLIKKIRDQFPTAILIAGGEHVSAIAKTCLKMSPEIDIICLGESEETIVEIIQGNELEKVDGIVFRKKKEILATQPRKRIAHLEELPRPQWDIFPLEKYWAHNFKWSPSNKKIRSINVLASRGCPYQCTFCSGPQMWGTQYVSRTPEDVANELVDLYNKYNINHFDFCDLTATINAQWIITFGGLIKEKLPHLSWSLPIGTRTDFYTYEVLKSLKESNCSYFSFCPESGSERMLKILNKKVSLKTMYRSLNMAKKLDLSFKCNFILGFPGEKRSDVFKTLLFCFRSGWAGAVDTIIFPFSPYPGSQEFQKLLEAKIIHPDKPEYYRTIMNIMDLSINQSFSQHLTTFELSLYRIIGMSLFYCIKFIRRPWTFFSMIWAITITKESSCLLEQRIIDMFKAKRIGKSRA